MSEPADFAPMPGDPAGWVWACDQRRRHFRDRVIGWASAVSAARAVGRTARVLGNEDELGEAAALLIKAEDGLDDALSDLAAAAGFALVRRPVGGDGSGGGIPDGLGGPLDDVDVHRALGLPRQ